MAHTSTLQIWPTDSLLHRVTGAVNGTWVAYWTRRAERATVLALHSLDDRTLKDIGMDRSEIESVVYSRSHDRRVCASRAKHTAEVAGYRTGMCV